jgi:cation diffusion facilitator family transporter
MSEGTTRVVLAALAGNGAIAVAKFVAAGLSGSSAMLTEAIHSLVDTGDQILMLVGQRRSARPPSPSHPLGYGMEAYFWSFIVALMVFVLGGVVSISQGVLHIIHPEPLTSPLISFGVLAVAAVFEGYSFAVGYREFRRVVRGRNVRMWTFIQLSKDPSLFAVLLEDSAALAGIAIAALGLALTQFAHLAWADGAASIAIGLLLMGVAFVLANETRSLIAGEAAAPPVLDAIRKTLEAHLEVADIAEVSTLHLGPSSILVALTVDFCDCNAADLRRIIADLTTALRQTDERIAYVFVRPTESTRG